MKEGLAVKVNPEFKFKFAFAIRTMSVYHVLHCALRIGVIEVVRNYEGVMVVEIFPKLLCVLLYCC